MLLKVKNISRVAVSKANILIRFSTCVKSKLKKKKKFIVVVLGWVGF